MSRAAAETARELGLRFEPDVERNEYGTKRLDYMFSAARAIARHQILENGDQGRAARPYETYAAVRSFAGPGSLTRVSDPRNHCSDA